MTYSVSPFMEVFVTVTAASGFGCTERWVLGFTLIELCLKTWCCARCFTRVSALALRTFLCREIIGPSRKAERPMPEARWF
jgi:hypothetical protein